MSLRERFVSARKGRGLSQLELANAVGVDPSTISRIERGAVHPSGKVATDVARVCHVDVNELLGVVPDECESADSSPPHAT